MTFAYTINALEATIDVLDHSNVMDLHKKDITGFKIDTNLNNKYLHLIEYWIVNFEDECVAKVISGELEELGEKYVVGNYKVYAKIDSENFIITGDYGNLSIVENDSYYIATVTYKDSNDISVNSHIYDGKEIYINVSVTTNDDTPTEITNFSYLIGTEKNPGSIKYAGTYTLMLTIGEYEYGVASTFVISPKVLELTSNYTEPYIYNSDQQNPEISTTNVIPDDSVELIVNVPISKNAGTYAVTVTGLKEGSNPNYVLPTDESKLSFAYTIAPRSVSVTVSDLNPIREGKVRSKLDINKTIVIDGTLDTPVTYQIMTTGVTPVAVATVDENGNVTLTGNASYIKGNYKIQPVIKSTNYTLTGVSGNLVVVKDHEYYNVTVNVNGEALKSSYEYASADFIVTTSVKIVTPETVVDDYSVAVYDSDSNEVTMKDAGNYKIVVTVDGVVFEYNVTITKIVLTLTSDYTQQYIYDGDQQNPEISTTNVIPDDSVELIVNVPISKNAGTYAVTVTGLKEGSNPNYVLPTDESKLSFAYTIAPRSVSVTVSDLNPIREGKVRSKLDINKTIVIDGTLDTPVTYQIMTTGVTPVAVATVDENGNVTLTGNASYIKGNYKIQPVIKSTNYTLTGVSGNLVVVKDHEYYNVTVNVNGEALKSSYEYASADFIVTTSVKIVTPETVVDDYSVTVNDWDLADLTIRDAATYSIKVNVDGVVYEYEFEITKILLELALENDVFTYNGMSQIPTVIATNLKGSDMLSFVTEAPSSINKGDYTIKVLGIRQRIVSNYYLPEEPEKLEFDYNIEAKPVDIDMANHNQIRAGKVTSNISFEKTVSELNGLNPDIGYIIKDEDGNSVANVDKDGNVTLEEGAIYGPGTYTIHPYIESENYALNYNFGTIVVVEDEKFYEVDVKLNGNELESSYEYNSSSFTLTTAVNVANPYEEVHDYSVMVNNEDISVATIKDAKNYSIVINVDGVIYSYYFEITKVVLTLESNYDEPYTYNSSVQAPTIIHTNVYDGDTVTLIIDTPNSKDVNDYTIKVTGIMEGSNQNYILPEEEKLSFEYEIIPMDVNVKVDNHNPIRISKISDNITFVNTTIVDGMLDTPVTYLIKTIDEEPISVASVDQNGNVTIIDKEHYISGNYKIYPIIDSNNYKLTFECGSLVVVEDHEYYSVDVKINNKALDTIYTYNSEILELSSLVKVVEPASVVNDYKIKVNNKDISEATIKDVGTYDIVVNIDGVVYIYTFEIKPKEIDFTIDTNEFIYDGEYKQPKFTLTGIEENDDIDIEAYSNNRLKGNYVVTGSLVGEDASNYTLTRELSVEYVIKPKPITVKIISQSSEYGNPIAALTLECKDTLARGDNIYSFIKLTKEDGLNVGTYDIEAVNINDNYDVTFENTKDSYEITIRTIRVTVDSKKSAYGDEILPLSATLVYGQLATWDDLSTLVSLTREDNINVGTYEIVPTNLSKNYNMIFAPGVYTITPRNISVFVDDYTSVYGTSFEEIEIDITKGSLAFDHKLSDLLTINSNVLPDVGVYPLSLDKVDNNNYNITINYTGIFNSIYEVVKRPITITANSFSVDNSASYEEIITNLSYNITKGNIVNSDNLNISLSVVLQSGTTLTSENFASNFSGGEHSIVVNASNNNYDIKLIDGVLTVTKRIVSIVDIQTEYTYNDSNVITVFDWEKNISNYDAIATSRSFNCDIYIKDYEGNYIQIPSITEAGEYKIVISIVHTHAYVFEEGTITEYEIIVNKKDISNDLFIYNIPNNNVAVYDPLGFIPGVELPEEYAYVDYNEVLLFNGNEVYEAVEVGDYEYKVEILHYNYSGLISIKFKIIKKDISSNIIVNVLPDELIIIDDLDDIEIVITGYNVNKSVTYASVDDSLITLDEVTESGNYYMTIRVNDSCYQGSRTVQIKVAKDVKVKIDRLQTLQNNFKATSDIEDKTEIMEEINSIIEGLDTYDNEQISSNSSYQAVVASASEDYDDFINYLNSLNNPPEETNDNNILIIIIVISAIIIIIGIIITIYLVKRKKA